MMSQQLYVCLFVVKKSLKTHTRPVYYTTAVYIENGGIRRYHVLENNLTLTKKSQSLNCIKTQNFSEVVFEFSFAPLIFFSTFLVLDNLQIKRKISKSKKKIN